MIRVLIADDQDLVRIGLRTLLDSEDDLRVVAEAADGLAAVAARRERFPHQGHPAGRADPGGAAGRGR